MRRLILGFVIGAVGGGVATWMWFDDPPLSAAPPVVIRDIRDVPRMSEQEAATHREHRFASLTTVEQILALPSDFDQTEALYVIAGRSNSAQLQHLIDQANRVADASDRRAGLGILFARLSDIDPQSALAMAGRMPYAAEQSIEASVWRSWGRLDLAAALQAASELTPLSRKSRAAQAIYGAYGYAGNDITEHIEAVLGVKPGRRVLSLYVQSLAAESAQSAIDYLNDMRPGNGQASVAWALGDYLGRTLPMQAEGYVNMLKHVQARSSFERGIMRAIASVDPAALVERYLADPTSRKYNAELGNALTQLAATDLDQAMRYFDVAQSRQTRLIFGGSIIKALARDDPQRAIEWASQNDTSLEQNLYQQAILVVAEVHPEVALEAANRMTDSPRRSSIFAGIIGTMARSDPMLALGALEQLPAGRDKQQAAQTVLATWVQADAAAAVDWALSNRESYDADLLRSLSNVLIRQDPDAAILVLPRLDEQTANEWLLRIVSTLARTRSVAAAESFMRQHKNSPMYTQMQAALIPQVARSDLATAKIMADSMVSGHQRDNVYAQLVSQAARSNPQQARVWLESIESEQGRASAVAGFVRTWAQSDAAAASRWVNGLAAGKMRDQAITSLIGSTKEIGNEQFALINDINDDNLRLQAAMGAILRSARNDPRRANEILNKVRLNELQRTEVKKMLERYGQF